MDLGPFAPSATYPYLLQVPTGLTAGTLRTVQDGSGHLSQLSLATDKVGLGVAPECSAGVKLLSSGGSFGLTLTVPTGSSATPYTLRAPSGQPSATGQILQVAATGGNDHTLQWATPAAGGTTDHAALTHLDYASAGHTGFAGTGVSNVFTTGQTVRANAVGDDALTVSATAPSGDNPGVTAIPIRTLTSNNTQATMATLPLADNTAYLVEARVVARQKAGGIPLGGAAAGYVRRGVFHRYSGGGASLAGSVQDGLTAEVTAAWDCTLDTNSNDVRVRVTGDSAGDVIWHGVLLVQKVSA